MPTKSSEVEVLWTFVQDGRSITYTAHPHQVGVELRVTLDGLFLWSEAFPDDLALLERALKGHDRLRAEGWGVEPNVGPR